MSKLDKELSNGIEVYMITLKNDVAMTNQSVEKYSIIARDSKR